MITYNMRVQINGYLLEGLMPVTANNYDDAFKEAVSSFGKGVSLPGTLTLGLTDDAFETESTNAGRIFKKELRKALEVYSSDNLDIVYDETAHEYCIMYHSSKNSFKVFGIDAESFIFKSGVDPEVWLTKLANQHHLGYCF